MSTTSDRSAARSLAALALLFALAATACGDKASPPSHTDSTADAGDTDDATADPDADDTTPDTPTPDPCGTPGDTFTRCPLNPVYKAGKAHTDGRLELFVADPSVLFDADDGLWKAWWQSPLETDYSNPDPKTAILYAESPDGVAWTVQDAPVLAAGRDPADWDYDRLETPSVIKVPSNPPDRRYVMFYAGGNFAAVQTPFPGYPWYQVGLAFSADGRAFQRLPAAESPYADQTTPFDNIEGLVFYGRDAFPGQPGVHDGLVADPEVILVDGTWHLYASSFAVDAAYTPLAFGVSHATSTDGVHWTASSHNPVLSGAQQPSVVRDPASGRFELFFNGDSDADKAAAPSAFNVSLHVSLATSADGDNFTVADPTHVLAWNPDLAYERYGWLTGADVVLRDDGYWLFYTGFSDDNPPENFYIPAHNAWCATHEPPCLCFDDGNGRVCLLRSLVTLNLARRARL